MPAEPVQSDPQPRDPGRPPLVLGAVAGLVASAAVGQVDVLLDRFVDPRTRRRERQVREGSPHDVAGPRLLGRLLGHRPSPRQRKGAQLAFAASYGIGWGLLYALARRRRPELARMAGLPFAVPFYLLCDGVIAPALGLTPTLRHVPAALNAKELVNHVAWTFTAEAVNRGGARLWR